MAAGNECTTYGMTRYRAIYQNIPIKLITTKIILGDFYLVLNYDNYTTEISALECIILKDTITVPRIMDIDFSDIATVIEKIKLLLLFS